MNNRYLFWFANEHLEFRVPEFKSLIALFTIKVKWISQNLDDPFWIVDLQSESDAQQLARRSVSLRSVIKLWSHGPTLADLHRELKGCPPELITLYLNAKKSFRVDVTTFNRTFTMKEKIDKIEMFNYLPSDCPVNLKEPDTVLHYIEYYGRDPNNTPKLPFYYFFGVWLCDGQRDLIHRLSLKTRKFIGNTSMDAQLSLIMANQAQIKPGDIVLDPFVGTGSLLVAAASFGAYVLGADIDYLMLHGKTRPTRKQDRAKPRNQESVFANLQQYGLESQYLDVVVADSSLPLWNERLKFNSIITDPPYGIREATERIGSSRQYTISAEHAPTHIPSKVGYGLQQIFEDLLQFAARRLILQGRLVAWIPVQISAYSEESLPTHPALKLVANSEQTLSAHTSRRLLTWEKVQNCVELPADVPDMFPVAFRQHYFNHGESRKERKERIAKELREKGLTNLSRNMKNSER